MFERLKIDPRSIVTFSISHWGPLFLVGCSLILTHLYFSSYFSMSFIAINGIAVITVILLTEYFKATRALNFLATTVIFLVVSLEISLRSIPTLWPRNLIGSLPTEHQRKVIEAIGLPTGMTGEGLIYYFQPNQKIDAYINFHVDIKGFRNSIPWQRDVDVVILGDSLMLAAGSKFDIADLIRADEKSAINLGMGGYGPQHYRDVLKSKIVDGDIKPKLVVVALCVSNDFRDAESYEALANAGATFEHYLRGAPENPAYRGKLFYLDRLITAYQNHLAWQARERPYLKQVNLPTREFKIGYAWAPPDIEEHNHQLLLVKNAIRDIVDLNKSNGSRTLLLLIPPPGPVYYKFGANFGEDYENYQKISEEMIKFADSQDINILDMLEPLTEALEQEFIFLSDTDTHFNEHGLVSLYNAFKSEIF